MREYNIPNNLVASPNGLKILEMKNIGFLADKLINQAINWYFEQKIK